MMFEDNQERNTNRRLSLHRCTIGASHPCLNGSSDLAWQSGPLNYQNDIYCPRPVNPESHVPLKMRVRFWPPHLHHSWRMKLVTRADHQIWFFAGLFVGAKEVSNSYHSLLIEYLGILPRVSEGLLVPTREQRLSNSCWLIAPVTSHSTVPLFTHPWQQSCISVGIILILSVFQTELNWILEYHQPGF